MQNLLARKTTPLTTMKRVLSMLAAILFLGGCADAKRFAAQHRPTAVIITVTAPYALEHPRNTDRFGLVGVSAGFIIPLWPAPVATPRPSPQP